MQQIATQGRERFSTGLLDRDLSRRHAHQAGTRAKYKTGGARLAIAMDTPIIPVAHNAGYLWPKGLFGKRPGTITITHRPADLRRTGKDPASAHAGSRALDRGRGRATGRSAVSAQGRDGRNAEARRASIAHAHGHGRLA